MAFRLNHYVAEWYQHRFLPADTREKKFFYLDKFPDTLVRDGHRYQRTAVLRWGPDRCFYQRDLYTARFGATISTAIEERFFGPMDAAGKNAVEYFTNFQHPSVDPKAFHNMLPYMSAQKLRTPKGLAYLADLVQSPNQNALLRQLQRLHPIFCALWTECVWAIVDAADSPTKFIISDHPVTVYNPACFPASKWCRGHGDPDIWLSGTHTLFPLTLDKLLILTNLDWARNPYGSPLKSRPNPELFRPAMFNFMEIQTGRKLSEAEVWMVNRIIKERALRYVAAAEEDWLYPEQHSPGKRWDRLTQPHLLMPDPRSMTFSTQILIGYKDRHADAFDEYGRQPGHADFDDKRRQAREWDSFHAFQGEFARLYGPKRRGQAFEVGRLTPPEDDPKYHQYHLGLEAKSKGKLK